MMHLILSIILLAEFILVAIAISLWAFKERYSFILSISIGLISTMIIYSALFQSLFMLRIWKFYWIFDILFFLFSIVYFIRNRKILIQLIDIFKGFIYNQKIYFSIFLILMVYIFLQGFLVAPDCWDSMVYNLARVLMYQNDNTLFLNTFSTIRQIIFPWGYDILHFHFTKVYSDFGLASFNYLNYVIIIINVYELIRTEFKNEKFALFMGLFVASFSQLLLQASNTKNDIPLAALTLIIINLAFHFLKNKELKDVYLILAFSLFGITVKSYYPAFVIIFWISFILYLIFSKKYLINDLNLIFLNIFKSKFILTLLILPIFSLSIYYYHHLKLFGNITGPKEYIEHNINNDGFRGAFVNLARYTIQFYNLPSEFYGEKISNFFNYYLFGKYAKINANYQWNEPLLSSTAIPDEGQTFFGVLANILIIPSLLTSLIIVSHNKNIKFISIIMILFFIALSYSVKWDPWRSRFMASFFVGSSLPMAFFIYKFIYTKKFIKLIFIIILAINLLYNLLFNVRLPAPGVNQAIKFVLNKFNINRVWEKEKSWVECVFDRTYNYNYYYGDKAIEIYSDSIPGNSKILFVAGEMIFPFMMQKPDSYQKVISKLNFEGKRKYNLGKSINEINLYNYDYILYQFTDDLDTKNLKLIYKTEGYKKGIGIYKILKD